MEKKKSIFSGMIDRMMANFVPQEDFEARITLHGTIVVLTQTPNGKEWVDKDANIYPEEMISKFPVYTVAKPVEQIVVGDIVKLTKSTFATVTSIKDGKVETLSFGGQHRQAKAFKDMFLGQASVRVVANLFNNMGVAGANSNLLMMLSMLDKESDDKSDIMKTLVITSMMSGNGQNPLGNMFNSPLALAMLMKGDDSSIQDILMIQALQGGMGNMFGNFGAAVQPVQPVAQAGAQIDGNQPA